MDINLLCSWHRLSFMQAGSEPSRMRRTRRLAVAATLANRIQIYQAEKGAGAASGWLRDIKHPERAAQILMGIPA